MPIAKDKAMVKAGLFIDKTQCFIIKIIFSEPSFLSDKQVIPPIITDTI
jgi:hypothetical protein